MKKLVLMLGMACLFMVACNNAPKQEQPKEEPQQEAAAPAEEHHQCPFCTLKGEYANWDNMDETAKAELNKKAIDLFAQMDAKKAEMEAEGKACCDKAEGAAKEACEKAEGAVKEGCEKAAEMTEEQKAQCEAKMAELKAKMDAVMEKWGNIGTMTLDEQKDLVLERIAAMGMGEGKCGNHEGEGHQCQHEAK